MFQSALVTLLLHIAKIKEKILYYTVLNSAARSLYIFKKYFHKYGLISKINNENNIQKNCFEKHHFHVNINIWKENIKIQGTFLG